MSDFKSKLPDLKELGDMTSKLFGDIKTSISEIMDNYKNKHPQSAPKKAASKPAEKKTDEVKATEKKKKA